LNIGITCYSTYGGSGTLATELGKCLASGGHKVHFITRSLPYRLKSDFDRNIYFHQVDMMEYPLFDESPYAIILAAKMAEIFKSEKLDVLHVHYAIPHAVSGYLAGEMLAPLKVPLVTTLHGTDITLVGKDPSFYDITRFGINRSTIVTAVSDYLKNETIQHFHPEIDIRRVYNFVDHRLFDKAAHGRRSRLFGSKTDKVVFAHISNFREIKKVPDVIRIFAIINRAVPDTELVLAGEGPALRECRQLVQELDLTEKVSFIGRQEDVVSILCSSSVLLHTSAGESFGLVLIEAMSCRLPVICTRAGGVPEVVADGSTGFLADVGDVETMGEYGILLARDGRLRRRMGDAGRERVLKNFTPEIIISQYEELYREAIDIAAGK
jgi:L-malate glycosyltransferase